MSQDVDQKSGNGGPNNGRRFRPANRNANIKPGQAVEQTTAPPPPPVPRTLPNARVGFDSIRELITQKRDAIARLIPSKTVDVETLIQSALQAVLADRRLCLCPPRSILNCIYPVAKLGLDFLDDNAFLIPRERRSGRGQSHEQHEGWYCSLMIGYKGQISVAARFGWSLDVQEIRKGDVYEIDAGTRNTLTHKIRLNERGDVEGVYCVVRDSLHRVHHIEVMDLLAIEQVKQRTEVWERWFSQMCRKSVVRRTFNCIPKAWLDLRIMAELDKRWDEDRPIDDLVLADATGANAAE